MILPSLMLELTSQPLTKESLAWIIQVEDFTQGAEDLVVGFFRVLLREPTRCPAAAASVYFAKLGMCLPKSVRKNRFEA